jgi:hypothetical protein
MNIMTYNTHKAPASVHVVACTDANAKNVITFTESKYQTDLHVTPPQSDWYMYIAKENTIVAATGIDFASENEELFFENLYHWDPEHEPAWYERSAVVFYSKLTSTERAFIPALMYYAVQYGMQQTASIGVSILNAGMARYYIRSGITWELFENAQLIHEHVPSSVQEYFSKTPTPMPYRIKLSDIAHATQQRTAELVASGELVAFI